MIPLWQLLTVAVLAAAVATWGILAMCHHFTRQHYSNGYRDACNDISLAYTTTHRALKATYDTGTYVHWQSAFAAANHIPVAVRHRRVHGNPTISGLAELIIGEAVKAGCLTESTSTSTD